MYRLISCNVNKIVGTCFSIYIFWSNTFEYVGILMLIGNYSVYKTNSKRKSMNNMLMLVSKCIKNIFFMFFSFRLRLLMMHICENNISNALLPTWFSSYVLNRNQLLIKLNWLIRENMGSKCFEFDYYSVITLNKINMNLCVCTLCTYNVRVCLETSYTLNIDFIPKIGMCTPFSSTIVWQWWTQTG